jgi:hypothetical protein
MNGRNRDWDIKVRTYPQYMAMMSLQKETAELADKLGRLNVISL